MYKKLALSGIGIFLFLIPSFSQVDPYALGYYTDALRFAQTQPFGTARTQGMGGVNNALGGDMSSLAGNPAGLGLYNRSELSISPSFGSGGATATYMGGPQKDSRGYLFFPSLGGVFAGERNLQEGKRYIGGAFGIGLTRMNNFQSRFSYSGKNSQSSMLNYFADVATGVPESEYYDLGEDDLYDIPSLAYYTYLIDPNPDDPNADPATYIPMVTPGTVKQEETVNVRGAVSQWNLAYGGNVNDKVYFGASLGLPQVRYLSEKNYRETIYNNDTLKNFKLTESLKVKGSGVNFKVGVILRPADFLRVGFTVTTPTYFTINENYSASISASFNNFAYGGNSSQPINNISAKTLPSIFKYNIVTPFKIGGGIALFAGKKGFISADIEYVPYGQIRLKENKLYRTGFDSTFSGDNRTIKHLYRGTVNLNAGGEYRAGIYRLRAGFSMMGDPYINVDNVNRTTINISGGAGIRLDEYFVDLAVVNSRSNGIYQPYTLSSGASPQASLRNSNTSFVISTGFFF